MSFNKMAFETRYCKSVYSINRHQFDKQFNRIYFKTFCTYKSAGYFYSYMVTYLLVISTSLSLPFVTLFEVVIFKRSCCVLVVNGIGDMRTNYKRLNVLQ